MKNFFTTRLQSLALISAACLVAALLVAGAVMFGDADSVEAKSSGRCSHSCSFVATVGGVTYSVSTSAQYNCRPWPSWGCTNLQNEAVGFLSKGITSYGWAVGCGNYHSFTATALTPPKIDGACGWANGRDFISAPAASSGYCDKGTKINDSWSGDDYSWSCQGSNGGSTASCRMELDGGGSCSRDADCDSGKKCLAARCIDVISCGNARLCPNATCPVNGACVPNDDFLDVSLTPSLVEKDTDTCLAAWEFDEQQTDRQAVVCTITGSGNFRYTATTTESGEKALPIGNYTLTCSVVGVSETETLTCRKIPRFQEF
jgi:hypothetical protein